MCDMLAAERCTKLGTRCAGGPGRWRTPATSTQRAFQCAKKRSAKRSCRSDRTAKTAGTTNPDTGAVLMYSTTKRSKLCQGHAWAPACVCRAATAAGGMPSKGMLRICAPSLRPRLTDATVTLHAACALGAANTGTVSAVIAAPASSAGEPGATAAIVRRPLTNADATKRTSGKCG